MYRIRVFKYSLHDVMDDVNQRLVVQPSEMLITGKNEKEENVEMMKLDQDIYKKYPNIVDVTGNIDPFLLCFNHICQELVLKFKGDEKRKQLFREYLENVERLLDLIVDYHSKNLPEFRAFLKETLSKYHQDMAKDYNQYCNNRVFDLFTRIVPYDMMTREKLDIRKFEDPATGDIKAAENLGDAIIPIREHTVKYMESFTNHVKMCVQGYMQSYGLARHIEQIDMEINKKLADFMAGPGYDKDRFNKNEHAKDIQDKLDGVQQEIAILSSLKADVDQAISEFNQLEI